MTALTVSPAEYRALLEGEIVVAFGEPPEETRFPIVPGAPLASEELKPAYRRWQDEPVPVASATAELAADHALDDVDEEAAAARHVRTRLPAEGRLLVLRVRIEDRPVLSDVAFEARRASLATALR